MVLDTWNEYMEFQKSHDHTSTLKVFVVSVETMVEIHILEDMFHNVCSIEPEEFIFYRLTLDAGE